MVICSTKLTTAAAYRISYDDGFLSVQREAVKCLRRIVVLHREMPYPVSSKLRRASI